MNKTATHMQYYYYQVGESAALGDLDGDGLPNDLCQTDVRAKTAMVSPVPGTGDRYKPFTLDFGKFVDRVTEYPSVCRIADMNEDGLADILIAILRPSSASSVAPRHAGPEARRAHFDGFLPNRRIGSRPLRALVDRHRNLRRYRRRRSSGSPRSATTMPTAPNSPIPIRPSLSR